MRTEVESKKLGIYYVRKKHTGTQPAWASGRVGGRGPRDAVLFCHESVWIVCCDGLYRACGRLVDRKVFQLSFSRSVCCLRTSSRRLSMNVWRLAAALRAATRRAPVVFLSPCLS